MPSPDLPAGFDFTDPDIYADRLPIEELAHMRKVAPIWWNEQPKGVGAFGDGGYWVLTKHKDVKEVSRRSDVFSSNAKTGELYDMSVMKGMVEKVGEDAWWLHHVIGPWDMAAEVARARQPLDGHLRPAAVRARPDAALHRLAARASTSSSARPASTRSR